MLSGGSKGPSEVILVSFETGKQSEVDRGSCSSSQMHFEGGEGTFTNWGWGGCAKLVFLAEPEMSPGMGLATLWPQVAHG
jgi:hypothetical protein